MKLRTIKLWAIYDPKNKVLIATAPTSSGLKAWRPVPEGLVVVTLKGHYVPPRRADRSSDQ